MSDIEYNRNFTSSSIKRIDTINSIASIMGDRMKKGSTKILTKMDSDPNNPGMENTYTPIAYASLNLAKELGAEYALGDSLHVAMKDEDGGVGKTDEFNKRTNAIGDAWVVNPPFQFNKNDDVRSNLSFPEFGRVFNEKINANYPIVVFEVGRIKYNSTMLGGATGDMGGDDALASRIRGDSTAWRAAKFPFTFAATVLRTTWGMVTSPIKTIKGNYGKYAHFITDTGLFAQYFNDMASLLATNMGLMRPFDISNHRDITERKEVGNLDSDTNNIEGLFENIKPNMRNGDPNTDDPILDTSENYLEGQIVEDEENMARISGRNATDFGPGSYAGIRRRVVLESFLPGRFGRAEYDYIPFLVGSDISVSESLSNTTQGNPLAAQLNSQAADAAIQKANNYQKAGDNAIKDLMQKLTGRLDQAKAELFRGDLTSVVSGEGRVVLPDMWQDSNYSRSISINFTFTSPFGHKLSIFENTYVPFLMLFCMTMPRQISRRSFTNPFFVRVNMQGFFNIPMGLIESLSIERGDDKNNWTIDSLPRTLKCSVAIKDLTPVMMMGMTRSSRLFSFFQANDGFSSYLSTLGGLSLRDQRNMFERGTRWWNRLKDRLERGRVDPDATVGQRIGNMLNPMGYVEPFIRSTRSGWLPRMGVKGSQTGLRPFSANNQQTNIY